MRQRSSSPFTASPENLLAEREELQEEFNFDDYITREAADMWHLSESIEEPVEFQSSVPSRADLTAYLAQTQDPILSDVNATGNSAQVLDPIKSNDGIIGRMASFEERPELHSPTIATDEYASRMAFLEEMFGPDNLGIQQEVEGSEDHLMASALALDNDILIGRSAASDIQKPTEDPNNKLAFESSLASVEHFEQAITPYQQSHTLGQAFALDRRGDVGNVPELLATLTNMSPKPKPAAAAQVTLGGRVQKRKAAKPNLTFPTSAKMHYPSGYFDKLPGEADVLTKSWETPEHPTVAPLPGHELSYADVAVLIQSRQATEQSAKLQSRRACPKHTTSPVPKRNGQMNKQGNLSHSQNIQVQDYQVAQQNGAQIHPAQYVHEFHYQNPQFLGPWSAQQQVTQVQGNHSNEIYGTQYQTHQHGQHQNFRAGLQNQLQKQLQNGSVQTNQLQNTWPQNTLLQDGQFSDGPFLNCQAENAQIQSGHASSTQSLDGQYSVTQFPNSQRQSGNHQNDYLQNGQLQSNRFLDGHPKSFQVKDGQLSSSHAQNNQFQNSGLLQGIQFQQGYSSQVQSQHFAQQQNSQYQAQNTALQARYQAMQMAIINAQQQAAQAQQQAARLVAQMAQFTGQMSPQQIPGHAYIQGQQFPQNQNLQPSQATRRGALSYPMQGPRAPQAQNSSPSEYQTPAFGGPQLMTPPRTQDVIRYSISSNRTAKSPQSHFGSPQSDLASSKAEQQQDADDLTPEDFWTHSLGWKMTKKEKKTNYDRTKTQIVQESADVENIQTQGSTSRP